MKPPTRLTAILEAAFVTFLWSTSWLLIKISLRGSSPPITFAGLRYGLAFICLVPFVVLNPIHRVSLQTISRHNWIRLILLGIVFYALAQGAQYVSLAYLPAVVVNLLLNLSAVAVGFMTFFASKEQPTAKQWLGIVLAAIGTGVYFLPLTLPPAAFTGLTVAIIAMLANAIASLQSRQANRDMSLPPLLVTFISMGIGAALMLGIGLVVQGLGKPTLLDWGFIVWMAIVNTALAFTLWNNTLRTLTATESAVLNSLMMPQIAILAVVFLGERLTLKETIGLVLVGVGVLIVQLRQHTCYK